MKKNRTNFPDWSALIPVLPGDGPRSRELYAALRRLIETGALAAGAKLPTTRDLAQRFGLSRSAAVACFEMLISEGFAVAKVGAGTFVAPDVPHLPLTLIKPRPAEIEVAASLPCGLGVAVSDPRTLDMFRILLSRHLTRPGPEHFRYGDPRGGLPLRTAIATYLRTARGVRCDAGQIVLTSGTQQGLDLLVRAALRPGDAVWIENPCYPMAHAVLAGSGATVFGVPVDAEGLDPEIGESLCSKARAAYVTPSHQYPLGVTMTMRRRLALLDWARRNDAWIIEDDYDSEFRYAGPPLTSLQGMDGSGRVAYLGTFSKILFPGLRIGYVVVPEALLDAVMAVRARSDRFPSTLAEGALTDLLNEGHFAAHLRRVRRRVQAARDVLVAGLETHCGDALEVIVPEQGLHLMATLKHAGPDTAIVEAAKAAGVGARALSSMFIGGASRQGLVLGFSGFSDEELMAATVRLGGVMGRSPGRQTT
ncbi:PLP-dependent aminotransferase family protein [Mesorhizobium sp. M7A.F.Ca.CA.001.09.2.1]|uniref:PLP-dependent aminotransferase family protein n=2 Tax=Mesorhizobium TaxID=68287 RepID=A0AB38T358_9HYPH|nr:MULTISPECIES: PLP-dependent aminotransferase family protein [Mesorhizobium]MDF3212570.1 PLP-dependent aminotransferase family protein [Mesorhizobium ciceri]RUY62853.1 PLP-dependent aminotransferase family protein [Mesorhizobium sp. M7A.F.Ca.CA.001.05.1.1]RUY70787.1 PLP-dependent aminotransferase family protein [Mesorhizobium sp. M7A.F.Ca.CA.001.13.1.1]RUY76001.1 PLP-dependent aminotransferase family protein [Mesorhizobium sp. M7A.F.Ca.CA.001.09.2.1]RUZ06969.1 PLP-dependent aminotransferase 